MLRALAPHCNRIHPCTAEVPQPVQHIVCNPALAAGKMSGKNDNPDAAQSRQQCLLCLTWRDFHLLKMSCGRWNFMKKLTLQRGLRTAGLLEAAHQYSSHGGGKLVLWQVLCKHLLIHDCICDLRSRWMLAVAAYFITWQTTAAAPLRQAPASANCCLPFHAQ